MNAVRIVLASVTGTAFMSLFSYFISERRNRQFREPVILSAMLSNTEALRSVKKKHTHQLGWLLHYLAGLSFSVLYDQVWRKTDARLSIQNGLVMGGINGFVGVLIWKSAFDMHPRAPRVEYKAYYNHLLAAHFVFGAFTAAGYMLPSLFKKKSRRVLRIREREPRWIDAKPEHKGNNFHTHPQDVNLTHH